jgi:hypothetical protein
MLGLCLILAVVAGFLAWKGAHPYVVTREEMRSALERILEKKMPEESLYRFVDTPITRDRYLDSLRVRLAGIPKIVPPAKDGAVYDSSGMAKIAALLEELRKKTG